MLYLTAFHLLYCLGSSTCMPDVGAYPAPQQIIYFSTEHNIYCTTSYGKIYCCQVDMATHVAKLLIYKFH